MKLSIVIPAYNEATLIAATLSNILADNVLKDCSIVVVCNGCIDNSLDVLTNFKQTHELSLTTRNISFITINETKASKTHALNVGVSATSADVTILLDADILVSGSDLCALANRLIENDLKALSPQVCFDVEKSNRLVKAYYEVERNSHYNTHLRLSNVIALSAICVDKVFPIPDVIADDEYIRRSLADNEYAIDKDTSFSFIAPKTLASVASVLARVERGNMQLNEMSLHSSSMTSGAVEKARLFSSVIFILTKVLAKIRARVEYYGSAKNEWHRDQSTRDIGE